MENAICGFVLGVMRGLALGVLLVVLILLIWGVLRFIGKIVVGVLHKLRKPPRQTPPFPAYRFYYDFELCVGLAELKKTVRDINECGYGIVSVTQYEDTYVVFFRRFANG